MREIYRESAERGRQRKAKRAMCTIEVQDLCDALVPAQVGLLHISIINILSRHEALDGALGGGGGLGQEGCMCTQIYIYICIHETENIYK